MSKISKSGSKKVKHDHNCQMERQYVMLGLAAQPTGKERETSRRYVLKSVCSAIMNQIFEHYQSIIPEKSQWASVCRLPLPTCLWANTLKITPSDLETSLEKAGYALEPLRWNKTAFRTSRSGMGTCWEYSVGLFQIQEEVSMLPVHFLDPQPGERVLDLCAAPGNKTAQIAIRLNNQGTVIANDKSFQRLRAFGQISKRLGLINVSTTVHDGRTYARIPDYFDKVLVDAPCSGEGVFRKGKGRDIPPNPKNSLRLQRIQIALLKKAIISCRPGGRIVYSTCTFAPEENEAVVDAVLKAHDNITLKPARLENFQLTPGITEWRDTVFHDTLKNTARIWPHLNNTGGFYIAIIEKSTNSSTRIRDTIRDKLQNNGHENKLRLKTESKIIDNRIEEIKLRFGFPETLFDHYRYTDNNHRGIYLINADHIPLDCLNIDSSGLFFIKTAINFPKLSTAAAMLFGNHATKNRIDLTKIQRDQYFQKIDFSLTSQQVKYLSDTGYVLCFYSDHPIGVGLYFEAREDKPPMLRSLFPNYLR